MDVGESGHAMLHNVLRTFRRSRWGDLPTTVTLIALAILLFCVVLLPSIIFPIAGLYIVWRLPLRKKVTLYAAYVYLMAAIMALWYLEIALSDRGIDYYGTGYIGIVPSAAVTGLTALLLILSFVDKEGRGQFKSRAAKETEKPVPAATDAASGPAAKTTGQG
jgi:hypothetical protein